MDAQLIENAKKDPLAFGDLFDAMQMNLYKFLYIRIGEVGLTEDICSEVWEKILMKLPALKNNQPEVFRAWMFKIALSCLTDHFRHKIPTVELHEELELKIKEDPNTLYKEKELGTKITQVLLTLPEKEKEVLSLKIFGEFSNKEIAQLLKQNEKVTAAYLARGLKKLRDRLPTNLK